MGNISKCPHCIVRFTSVKHTDFDRCLEKFITSKTGQPNLLHRLISFQYPTKVVDRGALLISPRTKNCNSSMLKRKTRGSWCEKNHHKQFCFRDGTNTGVNTECMWDSENNPRSIRCGVNFAIVFPMVDSSFKSNLQYKLPLNSQWIHLSSMNVILPCHHHHHHRYHNRHPTLQYCLSWEIAGCREPYAFVNLSMTTGQLDARANYRLLIRLIMDCKCSLPVATQLLAPHSSCHNDDDGNNNEELLLTSGN